MRVLFVTLSERSHLYCQTPLAWALAAAGHEVRVASSPLLVPLTVRTGLTAVGVGEDPTIHQAMKEHRGSQDLDTVNWSRCRPDQVTWEQILERYTMSVPFGFAAYNDPMLDDLVTFAQHWRPDLVVRDPLAYAAAVAARVVGSADIRLLCFSDVWGLSRRTFLGHLEQAPPEQRQDPLAQWLSDCGAAYGVTFDEEMVTASRTLDGLPSALGLAPAGHRLPLRHIAYNGDAVHWEWLRRPAERPRVCVSLGTSNLELYGGDYVSLPDILAALAELDAEVVAAVLPAQREALGVLPENVLVVDSVALHTLLPSCSVLVHHGGYGSFAAAMVHGVPQLVLTTFISDHQLRAEAVAQVGAGLWRHHTQARPDAVTDDVRRLLTEPAFAAAAQRLRDEANAMPSPHDVVPELERLVADR